MRKAVWITGIGLRTALGAREASWKRVLAGETAICLQQPFGDRFTYPLALVGRQPAIPEVLLHQAVQECLEDAALTPPLADLGIVVGSSRGQQFAWEGLARFYHHTGTMPADLNWLHTLPQHLALMVAHRLGSRGPVLSPMAACATGLWAIVQGYELIQQGNCQRVLVGAVEAPVTPLTLAGFAQMGALAKTGAYPFDLQREGLVLGEAAAVVMLELATTAQRPQARAYGQIEGAGLTADGYHVSAPAPDSQGAIAALRQCFDRSGLHPEHIDYVHAHGTATELNDRHEAQLLQRIFPAGVAVSSTKGATGHTLGASGLLGVVFCLLALRDQVLPPCVGLRQPAFALNLVMAAQSYRVGHSLCLSFGFGGQNAVVAIGGLD